jgi:tripartite-type tricarboxylate transporter receptor subunit TctC
MRRRHVIQAAAGWSAVSFAGLAAGQAFPSKPVTILVASAPGGPLDAAARLVAQHLTTAWAQSVVIEHRAGAGGTIAAGALARAVPDGHTLMMATRAVVINPSLYDKLPFDTATDIVPVAMVNEQPNLLVVPRAFPGQTMPELLKLVRQNPGKYSFGSPGNGGIPHLAGEMFMRATGTRLIHVPYRGAGPLMNDFLAGRVDMTFASPGTVVGQLGDGRITALAVASPERSPLAPSVPTFAELGIKDMNITSWYGLFAPARTPAAIVRKINADVVGFLRSPGGAQKIAQQGAQPTPLSVEEFQGEFQRDLAGFAALLKGMNVKIE